MLVLFETPAGFALFKVLDEGKLSKVEDLWKDFASSESARKVVELKAFNKFENTSDALSAATLLIDSKPTKGLRKFLKKHCDGETLAVADSKLGNAIKEKLKIDCLHNSAVMELMRGLRSQLTELMSGLAAQDLGPMSLGLSHSLSRYKLKFSPEKVDTMIIQAIGLLDDLDKELNTYVMRVREWYGWHFPELTKIVADNIQYAKAVKLMGNRVTAANLDFSEILPEDVEAELKEAAVISMGTEVNDMDLLNIRELCDQVLALSEYRAQLFEYLRSRMNTIAPNLTALVGELVGARLIAHGGSLMNLAKQPGSTIQILGAEKALFRALKTKHSTPKYGLTEDLQRDPCRLKDSVVAIKKDFRYLPEGSLEDKSASNFKNDIRPLISSKQKQQNGNISEINCGTVAAKDASIFYEEAKRHLSEMLKDNDRSVNYPAVQAPKSLEGILSLPHCNVSTPRGSPREKESLNPLSVETDVCLVCKVEREECAQERTKSQGGLESIACCTSEAVDDQDKFQERYCMNEVQDVTDEQDTVYIEGVDRLAGERVHNTQSISAEQSRGDVQQEILEETKQGKDHVEMSPNSPERIIEKLEQQELETPEPRASTEVISDGSPEQINEKQEKSSPVSVLESFFEDIGSPDCINKKECELHDDLHRSLYFLETETDVKVLWEDKNVRLDYIKLVLELSELCAEQNLEVWYLEDELISPCLFEELQNHSDQIDDLKLLFDCICEALTVIQDRYFRLSSWLSFLKHDIRTPPVGENLITEVDKYVYGYIQYSRLPSTLEQIIKRDLEVQTWMNVRSKTEGIIMEIWEFVLDELIDEAVFDLWI